MKRYDQLLNELLVDVDNYQDNECLELSAKNEKNYISSHAQRVRHTVQYLNYIFHEKNYKKLECKILDIGTTPLTFLFKEYFNAQVATIDLTDLFERRCKSKGIRFGKCNLLEEDIPFPNNEFDIIIFTEVFEHLIGPPKVIFQRIRKSLKENGTLIFSTPNVASIYKRKRLLLGKTLMDPAYTVFKEESQGNWVHGYAHWREFTMEELRDLLLRYDFRVIKSEHIKPYINIRTINPFRFVKRILIKILVDCIPSLGLYNLILAQKNE